MGDSTTASEVDHVQSQPKGDGGWNFRTQSSSCGVAFRGRKWLGRFSAAENTQSRVHHKGQLMCKTSRSTIYGSIWPPEHRKKAGVSSSSPWFTQSTSAKFIICLQGYSYGYASWSLPWQSYLACTIDLRWIENAMEELKRFRSGLNCPAHWWDVSWRQQVDNT